jgi:hypothetical protein
MILTRGMIAVAASVALVGGGGLKAETTTTIVNIPEICRAKGLEIYSQSALPELYEEHFTVTDLWAGMEPVFDFFRSYWKARLEPKKSLGYSVSIRLKYPYSKTNQLPASPAADDLMLPLNQALRHPWILRHLENPEAKASLTLIIRQNFNGTRDRFGLGFYLHHLGLEKTENSEESQWENFRLSTSSKYFNLWLNMQSGALVYGEELKDPEASQTIAHWIDEQGKPVKTQVVEKSED